MRHVTTGGFRIRNLPGPGSWWPRLKANPRARPLVTIQAIVQTPREQTRRTTAEFAIHGTGFRHPGQNDGGGVNGYLIQ